MDSNIKIVTHTLVRNGMPFIGLVLKKVMPYVDKCIVTISEKSTDGTLDVIKKLSIENPDKIQIFFENVRLPFHLTKERHKQLNVTPDGTWVLFLDDDDYWSNEMLEAVIENLDQDVDAFAIRPYQLIDKETYDRKWDNRWFSKWFIKKSDTYYHKPWPRDLIYTGGRQLYWKKNKRVEKLDTRFIHLSYLKDGSFRNEEWAKKYHHLEPKAGLLPDFLKPNIEEIYSYL